MRGRKYLLLTLQTLYRAMNVERGREWEWGVDAGMHVGHACACACMHVGMGHACACACMHVGVGHACACACMRVGMGHACACVCVRVGVGRMCACHES